MAAAYIQDQTEFDALLETEPVLVVDCTAQAVWTMQTDCSLNRPTGKRV